MDAVADVNTAAAADSYRDSHVYCDGDRYANADRDANARSITYPVAYRNAHRDSQSNRHTESNAYTYINSYSHAYSKSDSDRNSDPDTQPYATADIDTFADSTAYEAAADSYTVADTDAVDRCWCVAIQSRL